jgi:hypothetical protein
MMKWILLFVLFAFFGTPQLYAAGTSVNTQDNESLTTQELLVKKLERIYSGLASTDPSKVPVTLRLADLLAERARLASMKDLESGCTICTAGEQDRKKALRLYQDVLAKTPESSRGRVLVQMGHLHELLNQEKEALQFYQQTAGSTGQASAVAEANLSIAEIHFKKNRYIEAKKYYSLVLAEKSAGSRGLAAYRLAWCELNLSHLAAGLELFKEILKTPDLQSKSGLAGGQADHQFIEEVSRDLATWLSRSSVATTQLEELAKLSPESVREGNLIVLAQELERTGKKAEAVLAWAYVQSQSTKAEVRLEAQVRKVPLSFDEKNTSEALKNLEIALGFWQDMKGCGKPDCSELQKILRGLIVNWNQTEKKAPSENLLKAYELYLQRFSTDAEVAQWGAEVAKDRKQWPVAGRFMELAIAGYADQKLADKLESALLIHLENAEVSAIPELWTKAANLYLEKSPKKTKAFEVRYQQARKIYDAGDYKTAKTKLQELARQKEAPRDLRIQAAHLSLDAMNLLKDEANLGAEAKAYAALFGGAEAKEFAEINQKSAMNEVAKLAGESPEKAWNSLLAIDATQLSSAERKLYLKNKILLAEKTRHFDSEGAALEDYLLLKDLNAEEREFAFSKKAWLAELRLDFVTALKTTQSLTTTLKPDQKALKLAIYADLSGAESQHFYQQYLSVSKDEDVKLAISAELVRKSKTPLVELERQSILLAKAPETLARLYTEIYVKAQDEKVLKKALADIRIENTQWGRSLARAEDLRELKPVADKISSMKLDTKNQKSMAATIKSRATELDRLEKLVAKTIQKGDWTCQLVILDLLARESDRFYQELLSLPVPAGLSPEDESQYLNLLAQQANPYKTRADMAKTKAREFWQTAGWKEALQKSLKDSGEFRILVINEIEALKAAADKDQLAALDQVTKAVASNSVAIEKPSREILEKARAEVRLSPFDKSRIEKLLDLERQAGDFAMVHYLEQRLREKNL